MLSIILIAIVVIVVMAFFCLRPNRDSAKIKKIIKDHPKQTAVLLGKDHVEPDTVLSEEEKHTLLSMTDDDWKEWNNLIQKANAISKVNPIQVDDFIDEFIPDAYKRVVSPKGIFIAQSTKRASAILAMTIEELRLVCSQSDADWKKRMSKITLANEIKRNNPAGLRTYLESKGTSSVRNQVIISERKVIEQFQHYHVLSSNYVEWEKKQNDFSPKYRQRVRENYQNAGYYSYDIPYKRITDKGQRVNSTYKVWQAFANTYSEFHKDEQPEYMIETGRHLPAFKNQNRHFVEWVYKSVFDIIKSTFEGEGGSGLVVFITNSDVEWPVTTYAYHYRSLKKMLDDEGIMYSDINTLHNLPSSSIFNMVIIVDFITKNTEINNNCNLVIDYFSTNIPTLGYFSFIKEYSETEILEIIKNEKPKVVTPPKPVPVQSPVNEENDIRFLKSKFSRIKISSHFVYTVIPNTLIGSASKAPYVKPIWLTNPSAYHVDMKQGTGVISCSYSCPGNISNTFTIKGEKANLDDVVMFTYKLFKKMGVWDQFVEKGEKAVQAIISNEYVSKF